MTGVIPPLDSSLSHNPRLRRKKKPDKTDIQTSVVHQREQCYRTLSEYDRHLLI
jgi:hypothetical protein